jgi:hypothetical protein
MIFARRPPSPVAFPRIILSLGILVSLLPPGLVAAAERGDPSWLLPVPEIDTDPAVPTLKAALGRGWAEDITSHADIERYLEALVQASSGRARLETYGTTYEGRALRCLILSSPENMGRLDEIRQRNLQLADPRSLPAEEAARRIASSPAILWLSYGIHGNETSSGDAALITAYHLLADRRPETRQALERLVIFIDPDQNPDGRERFLASFREARGAFPQPEHYASEHTERWPGGRFNHYLFDLNRDWFLQSQAEIRAKAALYFRWRPQICVDAHEMGHDSHYFFAPSTDPVNPHMLPRQREWNFRLGRRQGEWFDRYGFPYTTREMFDAFYPGYGSEWPNMHGAIGVLWEQAGVRGILVDRSDETRLLFSDAVRHHYVSALATIETAAGSREDLLRDFRDACARGVLLGSEGPVRDFFLLEGRRTGRAARLARILVQNGLEVRRLVEPLRATCTDIHGDVKEERVVPRGSYHIPVAQPNGNAARILLDRRVEMGKDYVERQLQRKERRLGDEIYDVTAWSLPLALDVGCLWAGESSAVPSEPWDGESPAGEVAGGPAGVAYLIPADDDGALLALASWLQAGYRVHVTEQPLRIGETDFPRGTLFLRVHENPESIHEAMARSAREHQLRVFATGTSFVTSGAHLGGPYVQWVRPPKVLLAYDRPASVSVGHTWYYFDQVIRYPTTRVACRRLPRADLERFNVLILPDGDYSGSDAPDEALVRKIREWVRAGGTLVLLEGAAAWAAEEKVKLLASAVVKKETPWTGEALESRLDAADGKREAATKPDASKPEGVAAGKPPAREAPAGSEGDADEKKPEKLSEAPDPVPGAFLRARVFDDHWVTFGCGREVDLLLSGSLILRPLKPTDGRNLVTFLPKDRIVTSGFCWPATIDLIAGTPFVLYQALGEGHVIAFSQDPNFRAMVPAMQRFFLNAVFFGPAF